MMSSPAQQFTALVLAGTRPGGDPFAREMNVPYKTLVRVGGEPMIARVLTALRGSPWIGKIVVSGIRRSQLENHPEFAAALGAGVEVLEGARTPATSVVDAIDSGRCGWPLLVTTGDHALLTSPMVNDLCRSAIDSEADVAAGAVRAEIVRAAYPGVQRTFTPLRDGSFKGTNLFALLTPEARRAPLMWVEIEQYRKQPWRMVSFLGPLTLVRFLFRRLDLDQVVRMIESRLGARVRIVFLDHPEAALDVDNRGHLALAQEIVGGRAPGL